MVTNERTKNTVSMPKVGRWSRKEGMDRSTLTSSFAVVDKGNALCRVGTSRNSMLFKTLYELIRVYVKMYVHILPSYLKKYKIGKILKKLGKINIY